MDYAKVILPLKLDWEPFYGIPQGLSVSVGQRVRVSLAGREYTGVVHTLGEVPDIEISRVKDILSVEDNLALISAEELQLWEFISDYYMCTTGEVYNAAYPAARRESEQKKARRRAPAAPQGARISRTSADVELCRRIFDVFAGGRPALLLDGPGRGKLHSVPSVISSLARYTMDRGRSVLVLTPDVVEVPEGCLEYNSSMTAAARRDVAAEVRNGRPCVLFGTRMSVFLPFVNLGLVVVCDEHDVLYKQNEPSPRYNGRDVAVKLASIHGADVLLCSSVPSLESLLNCINGKYSLVSSLAGGADPLPAFELVDTTAERRKNGMLGSYSRRLVSIISAALERKGRTLVVVPWKDTDELEIELRALFPTARTKISFCPLSECRRKDFSKFDVVALIRAEFLLSAEDFRADERCLRALMALRKAVSDGGRAVFVIQSSDAAHPVFPGLYGGDICRTLEAMLPLRKKFNLPPYYRLVDMVFKDSNDARRRKMRLMTASLFPGSMIAGMTDDRIRLCLKKSAFLVSEKRDIYRKATDFALAHHYSGFIVFDVDPMGVR